MTFKLDNRHDFAYYRYLSRGLKGLLVGLIIVLPGMSGGTLILILGLYEALMRDLAKFRLLPWLSFTIGLGAGMIISGSLLSWLFTSYTEMILAFLLGCILASVRSVIGPYKRPDLIKGIILLMGLGLGLLLAGSVSWTTASSDQPHSLFLFIMAALASAAMILPGVPGSSVLIMAGVYEYVLQALADFRWPVLLVFAAGALTGVFALSNLFSVLYKRFQSRLSWLFAGLIIGSGRMLVPDQITAPLLFILLALVGFAITWLWDKKADKPQQQQNERTH